MLIINNKTKMSILFSLLVVACVSIYLGFNSNLLRYNYSQAEMLTVSNQEAFDNNSRLMNSVISNLSPEYRFDYKQYSAMEQEFASLYYIESGSFPQSKVLDTLLIQNLNNVSSTSSIHIDGADYPVYFYEGNEYVKFNSIDANNSVNPASQGEAYYKFEPVKWLIIGYGDGTNFGENFSIDIDEDIIICDEGKENAGLLVISQNILMQQIYNTNTEHLIDYNGEQVPARNDWSNSEIREVLNGTSGLLNTMFSSVEGGYIKTTSLDTSFTYQSGDNIETGSINTSDKLFLLSMGDDNYSVDMLNSILGGDTLVSLLHTYSNLQAKTTPLASATGAYTYVNAKDSTDDLIDYGRWWLRTGNETNTSRVSFATIYGYVDGHSVNHDCLGIRPSFVLDVQAESTMPIDNTNCFYVNNGLITGLTEEGKAATSLVIPKYYSVLNNTLEVEKVLNNSDEVDAFYTQLQDGDDKALYADFVNWLNGVLPAELSFPTTYRYYKTTCQKGKDVQITGIADYAFYYAGNLKNITIPNSVTSIGSYAFDSCYNLKSITIPDSVTSIGDYTFAFCYGLTNVDIPDSVTSMGEGTFIGCGDLTSVTIGNSLTSIGDWVFSSCSEITSITIPSSVISIGDYAFSYCSELTSITIPSSVTSIGDNALIYTLHWTNFITNAEAKTFASNDAINGLSVNDIFRVGNEENKYVYYQVTSDYANKYICFGGSTRSIATDNVNGEAPILNGATCIYATAFYDCSGLTSVTIPNSVKGIGDYAFRNNSGLIELTIPEGVISIGDYAFENCNGLINITIGNSVTSIGEGAFLSCNSLQNINYQTSGEDYNYNNGTITLSGTGTYKGFRHSFNGLIMSVDWGTSQYTAIDDCAFAGCIIFEMVFPDTIKSIGKNIFNWTISSTEIIENITVTSVTIPEGVTSIGERAFCYCYGLISINIPRSVISIGEYAFHCCYKLVQIRNLSRQYLGVLPVFIFEQEIKTNNTAFSNILTKEGKYITYTTDVGTKYLMGFAANADRRSATDIPSDITDIYQYAFWWRSSLKSIIIPDSVKGIGDYAFSGSGLTSIVVHEGNTTYDSRGNCNAIIEKATSVLIVGCKKTIIPEGVTSIGESAFEDCSGLTIINIPEGVTSIGESAFEDCRSLNSITIPDSVTSIGRDAFINTRVYNNSNNIKYIDNWCLEYGYIQQNTSLVLDNDTRGIGDYAFFGCRGLTSIVIPDSVISIGRSAFQDCSGLMSITIPEGVISIGFCAFLGCSALINITTPDSVTSIGGYAFDNTAWYNKQSNGLLYAGNVAYEYKGNMLSDTSIELRSNTKGIAGSAFRDCSGLTSITIPNSVTSIGEWAFADCSGLTFINIPEGVTSIGDSAFQDCSGLTSITIPNSVISIGSYAFYGCYYLTNITIGNGVTSIGMSTFEGCTRLTSINVENGNAKYDSRDNCNAIIETETNRLILGCQNTDIPDDVTSIGGGAFYDCWNLTSITIPNSVTSIGVCAFRGCSGLTSIDVEDGNAKYDSRDNCNAIIETETNRLIAGCKNTDIPDDVTSIGGYAFYGCSRLTSITIPEGVTSIGGYAFYECYFLTSITIPNKVKSIGNNAFASCRELSSVVVEDGNAVYDSRDNCNAIIEKEFNILLIGCKNTIIPGDVTSIGGYAFYGCSRLTSITIPEGVTSIGNRAFYECSFLKSVTFNNTSGWKAGETSVDVGTPSQNATWLTGDYCWYEWTRSDE